MSPQLWVVAGPNGSGKTTLVERFKGRFAEQISMINPDAIAFTLNPDDVSKVALKAGKEALKQQNEHLAGKKSFLIETTFSGKREVALLEKAKQLGYKTNLVFVGLESPKENICRVNLRVQKGGHHVPTEDIVRRYERSMANFQPGVEVADRVFVFDNTYAKHRMLAKYLNQKLVKLNANLPEWFKSIQKNIFKSNIEQEKLRLKAKAEDLIEKISKKMKRQEKEIEKHLASKPKNWLLGKGKSENWEEQAKGLKKRFETLNDRLTFVKKINNNAKLVQVMATSKVAKRDSKLYQSWCKELQGERKQSLSKALSATKKHSRGR